MSRAGTRLLTVFALSVPALAAAQDIPVHLLFAGQPLVVKAAPEFACLDRTHDKWIGCRIQPGPDGTRYVLSKPEPGEYTLHVYWELSDVSGAKAAIQEGLRRFPEGWQADQLRRTLERYEQDGLAPPSH
jgi:hypothetical protein